MSEAVAYFQVNAELDRLGRTPGGADLIDTAALLGIEAIAARNGGDTLAEALAPMPATIEVAYDSASDRAKVRTIQGLRRPLESLRQDQTATIHISMAGIDHLHIHVDIPLQVFGQGWPEMESMVKCFLFSVERAHPTTSEPLEAWTFSGSSAGSWLAPLSAQVRRIRGSGDQDYRRAWSEFSRESVVDLRCSLWGLTASPSAASTWSAGLAEASRTATDHELGSGRWVGSFVAANEKGAAADSLGPLKGLLVPDWWAPAP